MRLWLSERLHPGLHAAEQAWKERKERSLFQHLNRWNPVVARYRFLATMVSINTRTAAPITLNISRLVETRKSINTPSLLVD